MKGDDVTQSDDHSPKKENREHQRDIKRLTLDDLAAMSETEFDTSPFGSPAR
jgi:hypothetical protein